MIKYRKDLIKIQRIIKFNHLVNKFLDHLKEMLVKKDLIKLLKIDLNYNKIILQYLAVKKQTK